jgi:chemotaxis protein CheD
MNLAGPRSAPGIQPGEEQRLHVVQGEFHVTADERVVLTTILGSCVAACMRDPVARVGGLNHFLLPEGDGTGSSRGLQYGVHAMELLVNGILALGGRRNRLEAKLFGGARLGINLPDIGGQNAKFATEFLRREGISYMGGSLGGSAARRIQFWPASGRARQATVNEGAGVIAAEQRVARPVDTGAVELF